MPSREPFLEILRKGVHLVSILIVFYEFFGKEAVLWVLMLFLVTVLFLDYFRVKHGIRIPFFDITYRKDEADRFGIYY